MIQGENEMRGKTIKLYIMGEKYKNLKTAELSNWTGKAVIGERRHTKLIQDFEELSVPGIYFLTSKSKLGIQTEIYIGEADEVNKRINNHFSQKEWWDNFIIFISKDSNLTKAHVRFLEQAVYKIAKQNLTTLNLKNLSEPSGSKLPASDIDDMNDYLENMIFMLKNLGIVDFTIADEKMKTTKDKNVFYLNLTNDRIDKNGNILQAKMIITDSGYRLLKDSFIESKQRKSFQGKSYELLRNKIEKNGLFENSEISGVLILKEDLDFDSPSASASVVKNRLTNGRKEWKLKDGTSLDNFENK